MNTFKMKSLCVALAGVGTLAAGSVEAVNVNSDGTGQVLIYPYYTVRTVGAGAAPYNSLLSVVNTNASAMAVKVRFIEGKNSREVLDFNLFLSAKDVWTAAVVPVGTGAGVLTTDASCTVPKVTSTPVPFVNFAYVGDGGGDDLSRTTEGYIEIIEMGPIDEKSTTETGVTHVAGVPTCDGTGSTDAKAAINGNSPIGGLFGGVSLVNVLAGVDIGQNAVALDNFRDTGKYDLPGDIKPDLQDVNPPVAVLFDGQVVRSASGFATNIDAISALFMMEHVYNEFVLDTATKSGTDWVLTMPTKRYYYNSDGSVNYLFQRNFVTNACDDIGLTVYNREEGTPKSPQGFSPPPPPGKVAGLCYEANVLTFNGSNILGSANSISATTTYSNGWANLVFGIPTKSDGLFPHQLPASSIVTTTLAGSASTAPGTFIGLPVVGFMAQSFTNGTLKDPTGSLIQANYAAGFEHRGTRKVTTP
jgi:hypothetical protein